MLSRKAKKSISLGSIAKRDQAMDDFRLFERLNGLLLL
jgi:hypothetical protein